MWLAASSFAVPDGVLATLTTAQLSGKPHQGVPAKTLASPPGIGECNSTAAIGLRASLALNRLRQSERARYYGSALGRFTSVDPVKITPDRLRDPQQLNLYAYVRNNPLRFVDPDGEILKIAGDVNEAQRQLCELIGGDCSRISYDSNTNTITVNLSGIDLTQNEGASLLGNLVNSTSTYGLDLGSTMMTAGGLRSVTNDDPINLDNRADWRYGKGKSARDFPPQGFDDVVGIDPNSRKFRDSRGLVVPLSSEIFHELAEAYSKIDGGKQYINKDSGTGAHNDALLRELNLMRQRPNLQSQGRAGDILIRDPKPPKHREEE